jgi:predicted nucleic acid-binding protein
MRLVVDSYSWIEIFLGTEKGARSINAIGDADLVLTPDIVLAEISRKYFRERASEKVIQSRLRTISESSEIITIDETLALETGKAYLEMANRVTRMSLGSGKPSLSDAIVLAITRRNRAKVLTGDLHFRGLPETIWLG